MRLIDADALIENIVETAKDLRTLSTKTIGEAIHKTPIIDAEPVRHGKWISQGDCGVTECSCCGWNIEECVGWNYCPYCGAKMGVENDNS